MPVERFPEWPSRRRPATDPLAELGRLWDRLRERFGGGGGGGGGSRFGPWVIAAVLLVLYALTGLYIVSPDERGVVLRFGRFVRETGPGPHLKLPWPFEEVIRPSVTQVRKTEIGFRTISVGPPARYQEMPYEALMLTGDENIVKLEFIVQYKVKDDPDGPRDFLFHVRDPEGALQAAAEAAMREVVGRNNIEDALTDGKERLQNDTQALLQSIMDLYGSGIQIVTVKLQDVDPPDQVSDAFKDVISAQQDRERMINEANGYANDVVPRARGQAAQLLNEAEGYREAKVRDAAGAAKRFEALESEYAKAKDVTRRRLYLETMEQILPNVNKIIIDEVAGREMVPYLPLGQALRPRREGSREPDAGGP
jgi:modulator of FtsH protease HflK